MGSGRSFGKLLVIVVGAVVLGCAPRSQAAHVAVLVEPGLPNYGGTPALPAARVPAALAAAGIPCETLRADQLADPAILNTRRFTVVVMDYGNAFPLPAFDNLRAFHRAGGCLVMTGVPFCHPCVPAGPAGWSPDAVQGWGGYVTWMDQGHSGRRAVRVRNTDRQFTGCVSGRLTATPGEKLRISGWVRSQGNHAGSDNLFVRFFSPGGFLGQEGPTVPAGTTNWTHIEGEVTVPKGATEMDVDLQVWSKNAAVELDDVSLTVAGSSHNLLGDPGFEVAGGEWRDLGHDPKYYADDSFGIGTGGFLGPPAAPGELSAAGGNPLGFRSEWLPGRSASLQWLDPKTLSPEDEVLPVIELKVPGQQAVAASALIRHESAEFRGARDVWIGQVASDFTSGDRYAARQLIVRGVAWALGEKGKMTREQVARIDTRLAALPKPKPLPSNIAIVKEPRPWGDSFFPKSKPPARELLAVDVRGLDPWQRLALTCLQALTSRQQPKIWLIFDSWDQRWLDWHKKAGYIDGYTTVKDWRGLFKRFAGVYRGAVIPDQKQYQGVLLACDLAALEDLIVAPPDLAKELGLPVEEDLRGRFPTYAQGMAWLWRTYRDRFNHHLCTYANPSLAFNGTLGYDMEFRSVIFWISGTKDGDRPGADSLAEKEVMADIFSQMPPNIGMRGYPWAGNGIGLGEGGGVEFCGDYGKGLVCTDHTANVCVMSGVHIDHLTQPKQPPAPALERDKVYVAVTMSDGDNLNTMYDYFPNYFESPSHGNFPVGWGMGPTILDLMPAVAQWYYEHAKPTDEFLADVSGIFYVHPQTYAKCYQDRWKVFAGFIDWTARYMKRLGMRTVRPIDGNDDRLERYAAGLPFLHSLFPNYGRPGGMAYEKADYCLPSGLPVFHALTGGANSGESLLTEIRAAVKTHRPAFVNAFVCNWNMNMGALQDAVDKRDADMVFVTPAQLAQLYLEARKRGWAK